MIKLICQFCKKEYSVYNYRQDKSKFCSYKCFWKWRKGKNFNFKTIFKKGFIPWNANRFIYRNCLICKTKFKVILSRKKRAKFCSRKCQSQWCSESFKKENGPNWKGGKKYQNGYILIHKPDHPNSISYGYIFEHRLVMEEYLGRYLEKGEVVHHINSKRNDNRIENLELFGNNGKHMQREFLENGNWLTEARLRK